MSGSGPAGVPASSSGRYGVYITIDPSGTSANWIARAATMSVAIGQASAMVTWSMSAPSASRDLRTTTGPVVSNS